MYKNAGMLAFALGSLSLVAGFGITPIATAGTKNPRSTAMWMSSEDLMTTEEKQEKVPIVKSDQKETRLLKQALLDLADRTKRGFFASSADRKRASGIIDDLARYNPTREPASPYYSLKQEPSSSSSSTIAGKWTLVYTDAPDITGLDTSRNPFSTAELGRIGQECSPPYIKNVIEWSRPKWAENLPLSGTSESRVLQKVVTSGSASAENPLKVDLKIIGLELRAGGNSEDDIDAGDFQKLIQKQGLPAGLLRTNPVELKGPLTAPFGQFQILYLDEDMRVTKTFQNHLAVNTRIKDGEEWF
jgi:hypothetical protein